MANKIFLNGGQLHVTRPVVEQQKVMTNQPLEMVGINMQRSVDRLRGQFQTLGNYLGQVAAHAKSSNASVHMPKIGTGLAGGDWAVIEPIIQEQLQGIPVFVYEYGR